MSDEEDGTYLVGKERCRGFLCETRSILVA